MKHLPYSGDKRRIMKVNFSFSMAIFQNTLYGLSIYVVNPSVLSYVLK